MKQGDGEMVRFLSLVRGASMLAVLACCGMPVLAADLGETSGFKDAPEAAPVWRGFYMGLNAGGALGQAAYDFTPNVTAPGTTNKADIRGPLAGLQGGYNAQFGRFVTGIEADADFLKTNVPTYSAFEGGNIATQVNETYSLRGRLGYVPVSRVLLYGTGGYALANADHSLNTANGHLGGLYTASGTLEGWTAGGGIEYMQSSRLSFGIEALYYDFGQGHFNLTCPKPAQANTIPADIDTQMTAVRARVSFHLD
jgi:outer membrane immunogenic protein